MEIPLDVQVENTATKYGFEHRLCDPVFDDQNKSFLAMLDEYVSKIGYQIPEIIKAIDIGCGKMNYADALLTFLERYGKTNGQVRPVHLIGVDSTLDFEKEHFDIISNIEKAVKRGKIDPARLEFIYQMLENKDEMDILVKKTGISKFNFASIFAPGPDYNLTLRASDAYIHKTSEDEKLAKYVSEGQYITNSIEHALKPRMAKESLLVISTVNDGAKTENIIASLHKSGFDILLSEENKFMERFTYCPHKYTQIIIAKS
jgi:hypothetical protein